MKEWMEEDGQAEKENVPSSKRMKSDHSKIQFWTKVSTDEEIAKASKGFVLPNTAASTRWAIGNFNAWREWRNEMDPDDCVPENLFERWNFDELNKWLSLYVRETRRKDGEPFPTCTMNQLLSGLKRYMLERNFNGPKIVLVPTKIKRQIK